MSNLVRFCEGSLAKFKLKTLSFWVPYEDGQDVCMEVRQGDDCIYKDTCPPGMYFAWGIDVNDCRTRV